MINKDAGISHQGQPDTPTQAGDLYRQMLAERFDTQPVGTPRSLSSWDAEKNRLGSWNTGVGRMAQAAANYQPGIGQKMFQYGRASIQ